jgi:NADPH2:quinone reductase
VLGAAGGVGLAAIEVGKLLGARVLAAASSAEKLAIARQHGADETINYGVENLRDQVRALTDGKGVDVVFDPVGGGAFEQSVRCVGWEGTSSSSDLPAGMSHTSQRA